MIEGLRHLEGRVRELLAGHEVPVISTYIDQNYSRRTSQGWGDDNMRHDRVEIVPIVVNNDGKIRQLSVSEIAEGVDPGDVVIRKSINKKEGRTAGHLNPETIAYWGAGEGENWGP